MSLAQLKIQYRVLDRIQQLAGVQKLDEIDQKALAIPAGKVKDVAKAGAGAINKAVQDVGAVTTKT